MSKSAHLIDGPCGNLEVRLRSSKETKQGKLAVISHPHPLYSGTMDNKVVTTLERAFLSLGYTTVAYNFRGVGQSQGSYDEGLGEQDDLKAVVEWARGHLQVDQLVLAGFSFGSYVSLQALPDIDRVHKLFIVAPPVGLYDFSKIKEVELPWVLIQGGGDEVVDAKEVLDWSMNLESKPDLVWRAQASHFFHGELIWLRKVVVASL